MTGSLARTLWWGIGIALIALPALPIPRWTGAPDPGPAWSQHLSLWAIGLLVLAGAGVVAGRIGRSVEIGKLPVPRLAHGALVGGLAVLFLALAGFAMRDAFAGNPHLTDEVAQLFQAKVFASGRLAAPPPQPPEFFLITQTFVTEAGWVAQYPPAHAALLALGMLVGAEEWVNPLLGAVGVVLVYVLARGLYGRQTAAAAAFLYAAAAWVLFMSATYMNHVAAVTFGLAAWAAVIGVEHPGKGRFLAAGAAVALAAMTRPLDGVAVVVPLVGWLVARRRAPAVAWLALGALPVALAWGFLNWKLYGNPLTLGYSALYGPELRLGFGTDPWGRPFTPLVALSNAAVAVRRLHIYLYEWPMPALLPLAVWAFAARDRSASDLVVGLGILAAPLLYFFYWHSGFYPGPRFYYLSAPFLVIGTARAWSVAWARVRGVHRWGMRWDAALAAVAVCVLAWSWISLVPARWSVYQSQLATLKQDPRTALERRSIRQALVLVPESWSSRVATGLWALGAPPGLVERAFARADACALDGLARRARRRALSPQAVTDELEALRTGPAAPPVRDWPDPALRVRRGALTVECREEMKRDLQGFTLYGHLAWRNPVGLDSGIVFARDRYEENAALLARYEGWPVWRYAPPVDEPQGLPVLTGPLAATPSMASRP